MDAVLMVLPATRIALSQCPRCCGSGTVGQNVEPPRLFAGRPTRCDEITEK